MFKIYTATHGRQIEYETLKFSGGEIQVKFAGVRPSRYPPLTIRADLTSSDSVMELLLVTDALRRWTQDDSHIRLICPYLPYARQDRVMEPGESLALRVMCDLINSLKFESVQVWDVHSDVALALLDRVENVPAQSFVQMASIWSTHPILVAPDAGAIKKVSKLAGGYRMDMVRADKMRSTVDGSITGTKVYSETIGDRDFLIVDDICDGGRTFIELAKELRPLTTGKIYLYVTHGIFSRGLDVFAGLIDHIFVANLFPEVDRSNPILTELAI